MSNSQFINNFYFILFTDTYKAHSPLLLVQCSNVAVQGELHGSHSAEWLKINK